MKSFEYEMIVNSATSKVYAAITTQRGIENWWTQNCKVGAVEGDTITVRFGDTFKVMRIEELSPDKDIRWRVVEARLVAPGVTRNDEWVGTSIEFQLSPLNPESTRLRLSHTGLTPQSQCYDICTQGWGQFMSSLKNYLEKGSGNPYSDPSSR